ncbi:MAG: M48 family metalloprotease [Chitinivibrionales bacterium]
MKNRHGYIILITVLLPFVLQGLRCSNLMDSASKMMISDEEEVTMGRKFHKEIKADSENYPPYKERSDKKIEFIEYIDSIGDEIADAQRDRDIPFHFTIIDMDTVVNAFAVPGGYVYIYTGLILEAEDEAEIAGVLAHEIGHITKRYGVEKLIKLHGYNFLLDILVGDSTALRTVMDAAGGMAFLKLSRSNEHEADSCSVEYTSDAGSNPEGMKTFLEKLRADRSLNFEPLSTHPDTDKRIDSVASLISSKPASVRELAKPEVRVYP